MQSLRWVTVLHLICFCLAMDPPVWSTKYSVNFLEAGNLPGEKPLYQNNGTWYYDYDKMLARFDKGDNQHDFACSQQAKLLSPLDLHAPCQLLFAHDGNMYVIFPKTRKCCTPCGRKEYCSLIKPNWLTNATYVGTQTFEGKTCYGWKIVGFSTTDFWYVTDKNVPCQYHQVPPGAGGMITSLTFAQDSYKTTEPDMSLFMIPDYCKSKCPK